MKGTIGKILVVDDEVELKNILVEALLAHGYEAVGFNNGEDAVGILLEQAFDILLTDLMMPGMDGISLVREGLKIDSDLICIVMTGQGTIQTAVDAMKVGTFDYVLKPFRLQAILPVLTRAMNTRHLRLENVQLREAVAIHELSETIAFTLDPQTVLSKLADGALQQSQADEVSILLPTRDGKELYVAAVRGEKRERLLGERIPLEESISSWVARERQPVILNGEVHDDRFVALWPRPDIRSAVSVPLQVANKLVGVINLNMINRLRPFTLGQMKALTILAGTAAAALESASLYVQVQEAEKNYRSIFENAVEGIFQSTPAGRLRTVNPAFARILGYESPEDVIATVTDIAHQIYADHADRDEAARRQVEYGVLEGFEMEALRKDGERIWLAVNRRSIRNDNGDEIFMEGSIEDITERKQAEDSLKEAETRFRMVAENLGEGIFITDLDDLILYLNSRMAELIGYTREEVLGKYGYKFLLPPDEWPAFLQRNRQRGEGLAGRYEMHARRKDGTWIWLEVNAAPYRNPAGEIVGTIAANTDITERKSAGDALRESEERYRDLVENAHDIIYSQDLDGHYTSMNQAGAQITGYTIQEALSLNINQTVAPEFLAKAREMLARKLAGENVTAYEMEIIAKDGHRITVEANTKLVFQDGVPIGVQGIARDVTQRKQLEDQLRQSQKMEAIGQLAGGVAHDFNNLLTAINGYSALALQRIDENHPVRGYLEEVRKAGDRAANLTRQLLAFGRKQILQPLAINMNDVVTDMNKMLRRLIGEDIRLTAKLDPVLKKIKADPGQVEQVLVNLVVNARDAMPQGGNLTIETATVELDAEYVNKHVGFVPGSYVMLAVSDTGSGMDGKTQARIFDPFFTTKEKGKGTGLGLSTVYGIIKQSGGNISVYSELGHGTTFKVYLPGLAAAPPKANAAVEKAVLGGSETILLVEDEDVVRGLARKILEHAGYSVLEASRGAEAFQLCQEHAQPVDLLLTDVVMPETSGKEVADRLSKGQPGLRVLFMSGYTDEAIVHHGVLDSNVEFIQKPFTPAALVRKVREVLDAELVSSN
ncbi:MAG: two-component system, cell cycle sensor histidine kinase and response regulator CckA [Blastocatellia bacterium]|jgi:PAS domain S-box-containing protein|nr:two-component system, cell cycle sensor histidine kinase and response regulator CckA [Blastocatellia bacterium]